MNRNHASRIAWLLLLGAVAACPFGEGGALPTPMLILHSLLLTAGALVVVSRFRASRGPAKAEAAGLPAGSGWILAALAALGLSALRAPYGFAASLVLADAAAAAGAFLLAGILASSGTRRMVLAAVVIGSGLIQATNALWQLFVGGGAGESARPAGTFLNPNHLASYLAVALLACLALLVRSPRALPREDEEVRISPSSDASPSAWRRIFSGWLAGVLCAVLLFAGFLIPASRGALIGFAAGLVFLAGAAWPILSRRARQALATVLVLGLLAGVVLLVLRFQPEDPYRWERLRLWRAAIASTVDRPLLGIGPGQFSVRGPAFSPPHDGMPVRFGKRLDQTHSDFVRAFVEGGLVGGLACLAAVAVLLGALFRGAGKADDQDPPACGAAMGAGESGRPTSAGDALVRLGLASGVVVLALHAAVDNLSERPALVLTGAALAGAALARGGSRAGASGRGEGTTTRGALATGAVPPLEAGGAAAIARAVVVVAIAAGVHLAFVAGPWMAWRAGQEGLRLASIDPEGARTAIAAAIRWNPFHPSYRSTLAGLAVHPRGASPPGPRELAEGLLNVGEARRLSPEDSRWPLQEARLWRAGFTGMFHERSSLDRALAAYGEAERLSGVDPFIPLERATLHAAVGEREEAFAAMDRAIALEPNFFGARLARARLAAEAGDARSAQQALAEAERRRGLLSGTAPSADQLYERQILAWNEEAAAAIRHLYLP